jgi:hypothetical protein
MKKVIVILILVALLSGCIDKERSYYNEDNPNNTFTLKTDGSYQLVSEGYVWIGKYDESEDTLILHLEPPLPSVVLNKNGTNWSYTRNDETSMFVLKTD